MVNSPIKKWIKNLNRHPTKKNTQIVNKHKYSTSFVIKVMQIKMRYRMAKIKKADRIKCWWGYGATELSFIIGGMQNGTATLENSLIVSYNVKHSITIWSRKCNPKYLPKLFDKVCPYKNLHTSVYSAFIYNCPKPKVTKMSFYSWMGKQIGTSYNVVSFSNKNKWSSHKRHGRTLNTYS